MGCESSKVADVEVPESNIFDDAPREPTTGNSSAEKHPNEPQQIIEDLLEKNKNLHLRTEQLWKIIEDQSDCIKKAEEAQNEQKRLIEEAFETIRREAPEASAPTMTALNTQRDHCHQTSLRFFQHMQQIHEYPPRDDNLYPVLN
ncbi:Oidioi.mRNA.OKI2018_I69.PAR.g11584.t1.cds [Oikopleura dioica]|uniref:Oidioi.mRNA.OKI2018_I69.PAR.g11584.t1.cds n=1 Tax=Oikopleura dioica TaxID=34765 RepID=A0ABN7S376_OIKDI|nr:Oidioi.mRNA.OKI2018_I69.PAR.g11584.t1.cds [Oikopleura dioica]